MKRLLSWFDEKFAPLLDVIAMLGGMLTIVIALVIFILLVFFPETSFDMPLVVILVPGFIGFLGVALLMVLRLVRNYEK